MQGQQHCGQPLSWTFHPSLIWQKVLKHPLHHHKTPKKFLPWGRQNTQHTTASQYSPIKTFQQLPLCIHHCTPALYNFCYWTGLLLRLFLLLLLHSIAAITVNIFVKIALHSPPPHCSIVLSSSHSLFYVFIVLFVLISHSYVFACYVVRVLCHCIMSCHMVLWKHFVPMYAGYIVEWQ